MATIVVLPNRTKVTIPDVELIHCTPYRVPEVQFASLITDLKSNSVYRITAVKLLGALGSLGVEAIADIEEARKVSSDSSFVSACNIALGRIQHAHTGFTTCYGRHESAKYVGSSTVTTEKEPEKKEFSVDFEQPESDLGNIKMSRKCSFCEKETTEQPETQKLIEKLCSHNKFYCKFCLRNNYNYRNSHNVLIMSFRSILGYFYYELYSGSKSSPTMWLSEIKDHIELHQEIGLMNPVFNYDPDSYLWFVDFRKVGTGKKQIPISDVKCTIISILASFNLHTTISGISLNKLYAKYDEAITDFYTKRYRPEGKRLCLPTLKMCGNIQWLGSSVNFVTSPTARMPIEETRNFTPQLISNDRYWKKSQSSL